MELIQVSYNPFNMNLGELGLLAIENPQEYVFCMFADAVYTIFCSWLEVHLNQTNSTMPSAKFNRLVEKMSIEVLSWPWETVSQIVAEQDHELFIELYELCL